MIIVLVGVYVTLVPKIVAGSVCFRSSHPQVFLGKAVLKLCTKFIGEHPCRGVISIKLLCNFIEFTLCHACSAVNLLQIFRTPFSKNTSSWLLLLLIENLPSFTRKLKKLHMPSEKISGFCFSIFTGMNNLG